jgi:hypothetical protein
MTYVHVNFSMVKGIELDPTNEMSKENLVVCRLHSVYCMPDA